MIECMVCGRKLNMVTNSHLKKAHGITTKEYLEMYPGASFYDDQMQTRIIESRYRVDPNEFPKCKRPGCMNRVNNRLNKYCSRCCAMSHRMSKQGRGEQNGPKNSEYKNGWYSIGRRMKKKALKRDAYTCVRCGFRGDGKELHVHHIIPERSFDSPLEAHKLTNLVSLCSKCHARIEWSMIREYHLRALQLDELKKDDPSFVPLGEFQKSLLVGTSSGKMEDTKDIQTGLNASDGKNEDL